MLSARAVVIAVVVIAVLSLVGATLSLLEQPGQSGLGADTYGTRVHGYKAIFDVLSTLGIGVERSTGPPSAKIDRSATLALWSPQDELVRTEPVYLQRIGEWVRQGGRVVLAPQSQRDVPELVRKIRKSNDLVKDTSAMKELGLPPIETTLVQVSSNGTSGQDNRPVEGARPNRSGQRSVNPGSDRFTDELREILIPTASPTTQVQLKFEGTLASELLPAATLEVPDQLQVLKLMATNAGPGATVVEQAEQSNDASPADLEANTEPCGRILLTAPDGRSLVLAAHYQLGLGEVVVVGDPAIFDNRLVSHADNPVLAVSLLAGDRATVIWDGFYHGLTIRGNPLYLLTKPSYAILALAIVAVTAVWVWRQAIFLGPPLAAVGVSRRTVGEYVEAMARFFNRGSDSRRFMLAEVRQGVLWTLRQRFAALRGSESPEVVAAAIARHDPSAAQRLLDAVAATDVLLSRQSRLNERETAQAAKGLVDCL